MPLAERFQLTPLEVAAGSLFGSEPGERRRPERKRGESPLAALESVIREGLQRAPCLVAFSGGRDSSAVLAVAAALARREQLPLPIPITLRFPEAAATEEADWQERVVAAVGLHDWVRIGMTDELDCVGPIATRVLERHGLMWPSNAHLLVPMLEDASSGSLLTGNGGDQYFAASPTIERPAAVLGRRVRPEPRDILRIGLALSPRPLRRAVLVRRPPDPRRGSWLREGALRAVHAAWARDAASEPLRLGPRVRWSWRLRGWLVGMTSLELLAADAGTLLLHPFDTHRFLDALTREPKVRGLADRTEVMRRLFGSVLPDDVCSRSSKASFNDVFWNRHSEAFAERWTGAGADPELVDIDVLRSLWTSPEARNYYLSTTQLQAAWLAERRRLDGAAQ